MLIIRIIIILAIFWLSLMLVGWLTKLWLLHKFKSATKQQPDPQQNLEAEKLIKCTYCGTYIVKENAIIKNNDTYCSEEHAKK